MQTETSMYVRAVGGDDLVHLLHPSDFKVGAAALCGVATRASKTPSANTCADCEKLAISEQMEESRKTRRGRGKKERRATDARAAVRASIFTGGFRGPLEVFLLSLVRARFDREHPDQRWNDLSVSAVEECFRREVEARGLSWDTISEAMAQQSNEKDRRRRRRRR